MSLQLSKARGVSYHQYHFIPPKISLPILCMPAHHIIQQIRSPDQTQTKAPHSLPITHKYTFQLLIYAESKGDGSTPTSPSNSKGGSGALSQHISSSSSDSIDSDAIQPTSSKILLQHHISYYRMHCISNIDNGDRCRTPLPPWALTKLFVVLVCGTMLSIEARRNS